MVFWIKKKEKRKYAFLIFLIPFLMIWSIYSYTNILKPRFLDIRYYINQDYEVDSGKCMAVNDGGRGITPSFLLEEKIYYYNPRFNKVHDGESYLLKYLPNSKYVIEVESIK